ncbi:hypothetical protein [Aureimonas pseudogalii]|uniref:Vacuolar-type H+-ATPase subunit H n=1 Tax=Aureimonas pseudogalii TaxID=1744844 RepID=A0A7W6H5M8_9HYPH|nr:hypothetical protein [Aureimonas pseudogalii]MBB3999003.1 vacuolar-type H+-ATPase subunit H [Aureimonas pseudogalii]
MVDIVERGPAVGGSVRRISWGAIIAGTILTLVVQMMLALLGLGIGLATIDTTAAETPSLATFSSAGGIWTALTVLIATFVGGYAAARLAGSLARRDAALHGIVTWATSTLIVVYLLTSGVSAIVTGAFGALGSTVSTLGSAASSVVQGSPAALNALPPQLQQQARALLARGQNQAQQAAGEVQQQAEQTANTVQQAAGTQDLGQAVSTVFQGLSQDATPDQRQAAVQVISTEAGISQQEAEQRLTQFQGQYDQAVAQAKETAAQAAATASTTAFVAFVGLFLGLIVGALGGIVGKPARAVGYYRD